MGTFYQAILYKIGMKFSDQKLEMDYIQNRKKNHISICRTLSKYFIAFQVIMVTFKCDFANLLFASIAIPVEILLNYSKFLSIAFMPFAIFLSSISLN